MEAEWPAGKGQKGEEEDRLAWLNRRRQIFGWTGPKPSRTKSCQNGAEVQLLDDTRFDTRPSWSAAPESRRNCQPACLQCIADLSILQG
jgi:hypothetical protein